MTLCRLIAPQWLLDKYPNKPRVLEGLFSDKDIKRYNKDGYNIYARPNHPKHYEAGTVSGSHIDVYTCCFIDYDCKTNTYASKTDFIEAVGLSGLNPSSIVDSGNGVHVYWKVSDLDAMSFLRLSRRLMRLFNTDDAVQTLAQLMRLPGTNNTKNKDHIVPCTQVYESDIRYTCEELDKSLPAITLEDEEYCKTHYDNVHNPGKRLENVSEALPPKFGKLLRANQEVKDIWSSTSDDRSKDDYRLGHILFGNDFTKEEAISVLINTAKAMSRAPIHRLNYATNIVEKIWTYEEATDKSEVNLSPTVRDILVQSDDKIKGTRFPCNRLVDDTEHGFRLGQVIGIVGGSGVGKTTLVLNKFIWFAQNNPNFHHFFISLEQPPGELASRIKTITQGNDALYDKIHIVSNYGADGEFKHLTLQDIEDHLLAFKKQTGFEVGATVIDHIGVINKKTENGENDGLIEVCRKMKGLAVRVNTMLIMLSQAPREKAGIGDLELDKSSAYGTVFFESFCDYVLLLWQPLKRVYSQGAPTIMALKFGKIRHKKQGVDRIQEDTCYQLYFDPNTEQLRELTQDEETAAKFFQNQAVHARKLDKKTDLVPYQSRRVIEDNETKPDHN